MTQDDWTRINQIFADKVTKGIEENVSSSFDALNKKIDFFADRLSNIVTDVGELSLLHTQTQKQVDNIRNRTYQLEEQQNLTIMKLDILNSTVIRVETGFKEFNSNFMDTYIDPIEKRVTKLEVEQELLSTNVSILSSAVYSYHSNNAALPSSSTTVICLTFTIGLCLAPDEWGLLVP